MRAAVDISMYPLTGDYLTPIQAFIDRLNTHSELQVLTNTLSTQIWGELDRVLAILADEMRRSAEGGPQLIFVMKVLPGVPGPTVARLAEARAAEGQMVEARLAEGSATATA
jgi:uncharacterized protein YqgV (UPF0045/DUF77 family)